MLPAAPGDARLALQSVAMVHGSDRTEVEAKRQEISALLGPACRHSDVLYSKRILKKTGLRLSRNEG